MPLAEIDVDGNCAVNCRSLVERLPENGVGFKIDCFDAQGTRQRTIRSPYLNDNGSEFVERDFHFLIPDWTFHLIVGIENRTQNAVFVDNIRLTTSEVPAGAYTSELGSEYNSRESPAMGTFVSAIPVSPTADPKVDIISDLINNVTNPSHVDYGKIVWLQPGTHCYAGIGLKNGLHIKAHRDAVLFRGAENKRYNFTEGFYRTTYANSQVQPVEDVVIEGGFYVSNSLAGNIASIAGNRVVIRNVFCPTWSSTTHPISALTLFGSDITIHNNVLKGPGSSVPALQQTDGYAGIQFWGGNRLNAMHNVTLAGDDGVGLFPQRIQTDNAFFNFSITNCEIYNNLLETVGSEAFACGLSSPTRFVGGINVNVLPRLTAEVYEIRAHHFTGVCGGETAMIVVMNTPKPHFLNDNLEYDFSEEYFPTLDSNLTPQVRDIHVERALIVGRENLEPRFGIRLQSGDIGSLKDITVFDVFVAGMRIDGLSIVKQGADPNPDYAWWTPAKNVNLKVQDCTINAATALRTFQIQRIEPANEYNYLEFEGSEASSSNSFVHNPSSANPKLLIDR